MESGPVTAFWLRVRADLSEKVDLSRMCQRWFKAQRGVWESLILSSSLFLHGEPAAVISVVPQWVCVSAAGFRQRHLAGVEESTTLTASGPLPHDWILTKNRENQRMRNTNVFCLKALRIVDHGLRFYYGVCRVQHISFPSYYFNFALF